MCKLYLLCFQLPVKNLLVSVLKICPFCLLNILFIVSFSSINSVQDFFFLCYCLSSYGMRLLLDKMKSSVLQISVISVWCGVFEATAKWFIFVTVFCLFVFWFYGCRNLSGVDDTNSSTSLGINKLQWATCNCIFYFT